MDFVQQAGRYRHVVEAELAALFTPDGLLTDAGIPETLQAPLRYAFLTGGKRLRPVLCLAACQAVSGAFEPALPAALAIEALHTYTLVHDDLPCMDDDVLRRGQPTVHAKYGYAEGVLAGDALQAAAFDLALRTPVPASAVCALARELAAAAGPAGVVGGQWVDVTAKPPHDDARVACVHEQKTAALIRCALAMGGIAGGADDAQLAALKRYGLNLGVAFQIIDDLLDADDPTKADEMGVLRIMGADEAKRRADTLTSQALAELEALDNADPARAEAVSLLRHLAEDQVLRTK
ncbi:MAG: polyprenyl synthetase family protein [Kiritimatiellia bacterium]